MPGPDHCASLEPAGFARMVRGIRRVSHMRGDGVKAPRPEERDTARVARRSVVAMQDIAANTPINTALLAAAVLPRASRQKICRCWPVAASSMR
jgi:N,N'-diacetyllegionaminate synthase